MVTSGMSAVGETPEKTRPGKNVEKKVLNTADVTITISDHKMFSFNANVTISKS